MRLVTTTDGIGRLEEGGVALLELPWGDLGALLAAGEGLAPAHDAAVRRVVPLGQLVLRPPVPRPGKVWAVGLNYRSHIEEMGRDLPTEPVVFVKLTSSVVATGATVRLPPIAPGKVDYEGEVAVVIGRRAKAVGEHEAWSHVAGVTACNDVTARDVQHATGNFTLAKSFDTFTPLGPSLATVDEYADPDDIGVRTIVDGELRQDSRTSDLLFTIPFLVSWFSHRTTLEPGDVISTGTPAGVGHPEGRYLVAGSVVEVHVEGVLPLANTVAG
jgi:2-keto-4-pentenoate hydratase/2-oxohepta-3-ene-1,7-dioic acid hydratase in catechol pathway